ncbi:MAG: sugar transporter [Lysobacteraceae bacterium]|nr:MAG: sugar transporter [Xanthomonadaceae bacterium]
MKRLVALLAVASALSACGNKGPLVMPDDKPAEAPAKPAEQPAAVEPAADSGTPGRR